MQNTKLDEILSREKAYLTNKALHTKYKIQYVSEYLTSGTIINVKYFSYPPTFIISPLFTYICKCRFSWFLYSLGETPTNFRNAFVK